MSSDYISMDTWGKFVSACAQYNSVIVASDCSGWCSEVMAAKMVSALPVLQAFASDVSKPVRTLFV